MTELSPSFYSMPSDSTLSTRLALHGVEGNKKKISKEKIDQVAQDFESLFLSVMLQPMFKASSTQQTSFYNNQDEKTYRAMLTDEYAKSIAKSGGIGIADMIRKQLLNLQEAP